MVDKPSRERRKTVYEVLREKLGREPTHRELCDDVRRILGMPPEDRERIYRKRS